MQKNNGNKQKLLNVMDILAHMSGRDNPLTAQAICDELAKRGISAERKSVCDDIKALREFGLNIVHKRTDRAGYYCKNELFTLAETELLVELVYSCDALTQKDKIRLIDKLQTLSRLDGEYICSKRFEVSGNTFAGEQSLENIRLLNDAIFTGREVSFLYSEFVLDSECVGVSHKKVDCSVIRLKCDCNRVIAVCRECGETVEYDVAKISRLTEGKIKTHSEPFGGLMCVDVICDNGIVDDALSLLGSENEITKFDETHFRVRVKTDDINLLKNKVLLLGDKAEMI